MRGAAEIVRGAGIAGEIVAAAGVPEAGDEGEGAVDVPEAVAGVDVMAGEAEDGTKLFATDSHRSIRIHQGDRRKLRSLLFLFLCDNATCRFATSGVDRSAHGKTCKVSEILSSLEEFSCAGEEMPGPAAATRMARRSSGYRVSCSHPENIPDIGVRLGLAIELTRADTMLLFSRQNKR